MTLKSLKVIATIALLSLLAVTALAFEDSDVPPADIVNDESGVEVITGILTVTNRNIPIVFEEPLLLLEDQAGYVDDNIDYEFPVESQVFGQFIGDFFTQEEVPYRMPLPLVPGGNSRDVDNDDLREAGVQIYQVGLWANHYGDQFIEYLDGHGWSSSYSSAETSIDPRKLYEYIGGNILIYAPDDQQSFPAGFGEDGLIFTEDDPIVSVPAGYTAVNMDTEPFTFDRSNEVTFDLFEQETIAPHDFSDLGYAAAFDELIEVARNEYAFTEFKEMDWDALHEQFRPRFEEAQENDDFDAYLFALRDFAWSIPDSHVAVSTPPGVNTLTQDFLDNTAGGLGLSPVELDDGRIVINFLLEGGPAAEAGIELGAELLAINGTPIEEAIENAVAYSAPFSAPHYERLQRLRYSVRFPADSEVELTYRNPEAEDAETVTLQTVDERESFSFSSFFRGFEASDPPVTFDFLDSGYAYVKVNSFGGRETLMIGLWEYFLEQVRAQNAQGIIIDNRTNGGGFSSIGRRMAAYFFEEEIDVYYSQSYNPIIDEFFYDERFPATIQPEEDQPLYYGGPLVVLVGPGCASACEFFTYNFIQEDRATTVGHYPTGGLAGGHPPLTMPGNVNFALPASRPVDLDGETIIIEGEGIAPDVVVPVNEETAFSDEDVILEAAVAYLDDLLTADIEEGGELALGDEVTGTLTPGTRVQYSFTIPANTPINVYLDATNDDIDTYLRLLSADGEQVLAENDDIESGVTNSALEGLSTGSDFPVIIEVGTFEDAGEGDYTLRVIEAEE